MPKDNLPNLNKPVPVEPDPTNPEGGNPTDISYIFELYYDRDDLNYELSFSGKAKTIIMPSGQEIALSPGLSATFTNLDDRSESVTVNASGSFHTTFNEDGSAEVVVTGRNLLFDPAIRDGQPGLVLVSGRFSYTLDPNGVLDEPLSGRGNIIDVYDLLI